jgi:hypothetical protein
VRGKALFRNNVAFCGRFDLGNELESKVIFERSARREKDVRRKGLDSGKGVRYNQVAGVGAMNGA